jgi:hypothetical protein
VRRWAGAVGKHAERLRKLIPTSSVTRLDDQGHLSIIAELPELAALSGALHGPTHPLSTDEPTGLI